jgi:hypothetical protein
MNHFSEITYSRISNDRNGGNYKSDRLSARSDTPWASLTSLVSLNLQIIANPDFPFQGNAASVEGDTCSQTQSTNSEEGDKHEGAQAAFLGEFGPHFVAILNNRSIIWTNVERSESGCTNMSCSSRSDVPTSTFH